MEWQYKRTENKPTEKQIWLAQMIADDFELDLEKEPFTKEAYSAFISRNKGRYQRFNGIEDEEFNAYGGVGIGFEYQQMKEDG